MAFLATICSAIPAWGATISIPVTKRQSLKFSGSTGAVTNIGADFVSIGVAYQYLWGGGL